MKCPRCIYGKEGGALMHECESCYEDSRERKRESMDLIAFPVLPTNEEDQRLVDKLVADSAPKGTERRLLKPCASCGKPATRHALPGDELKNIRIPCCDDMACAGKLLSSEQAPSVEEVRKAFMEAYAHFVRQDWDADELSHHYAREVRDLRRQDCIDKFDRVKKLFDSLGKT